MQGRCAKHSTPAREIDALTGQAPATNECWRPAFFIVNYPAEGPGRIALSHGIVSRYVHT